MSYEPDTLDGVITFCENEGQACESVRKVRGRLAKLLWERDELARELAHVKVRECPVGDAEDQHRLGGS